MRAGLLRRFIEIQSKAIIRDAYGAETETYTTIFSTRADVRYKSGTKAVSEMEVFNDQSIEFNIRYRAGINETMRIKFNNRLYKISFINETEFHRSLNISAERIIE